MKKILLLFLTMLLPLFAIDKIFIGTIDSEPHEKIYKFQALADYLESKLKDGNIKVEVEIPKDINSAIEFVVNNKLHIFIDSVYPTILIKNEVDLNIVSKRWKKGIEGYKSVIFTKKGSLINSIKDLKNKTISFEDEYSTSGYYVPKKDILKEGIILSNKGEKDSLKYQFSRSEQNSAMWVMYGKVDAAVTDDNTFKSFNNGQFKIIHKSKLVPRHLVSFSKKIDTSLQKKILDILYSMDKTKEGKKVLKKFSKTKKFSPLSKDDIQLIKGI